MGLEFSYTIQDQVLVITPLEEKIDAMNASAFKETALDLIRKTELSKLVLDLGHVQFIDSSGLGTFFSLQRKLSQQGGGLKLANLNKNIHAMFEIVSINRILDIFPITEEAIKSF